MTQYYEANHLKPSRQDTACLTQEADKTLNTEWCGETLKISPTPDSLGVILNHTSFIKDHSLKLKAKVTTRNNFLRKLVNHKSGTHNHPS